MAVVIPFVGASHAYRRKFDTKTFTGGTASDVSPTGNKIFAYGYARALRALVTTKTAGTGGTLSADDVWGLFGSGLKVTQPGGQELYGGANFTGFMAYLAAKQAAWKGVNDPKLYPSFASSATAPKLQLPVVFELNSQTGMGSLPNENDAAPWQCSWQAAGSSAYTTAPTTAPALQVDWFLDAWTIPSATNPLDHRVSQQTAPPGLGTLNKWTVQQVVIPSSSAFAAPLIRKGNSLRQVGLITTSGGSPPTRVAITNFPDPLTVEWDGVLIRSNDSPTLILDDEFASRLGAAGPTPEATDTGVLWLKHSDPAGIDVSGIGLDGTGMSKQWGTTASSTITLNGTWGAAVTLLLILTNDVQYVIPAANPYALRGGSPAGNQQLPVQPSALT